MNISSSDNLRPIFGAHGQWQKEILKKIVAIMLQQKYDNIF